MRALLLIVAISFAAFQSTLAVEPQMRTWTSRNGKTLEALLVTADAASVSVKQADGTMHKISAQNLSQTDIDYVQGILTQSAQEEALKKEQALKEKALAKLNELGWKTGQQEVDLPESLKDSQSLSSKFYLYIPENYGATNTGCPLVIFLHGAGERGSELKQLTKHGIPKLAAKKKFPFIAVSPQCKPDQWWNSEDLKKLLDYVLASLDADQSRLYITGLSMGGFGTWDMITRYPELFAAAIPICGGGDPNKTDVIKDMPIWVFHGDADPTIPIQRSQDMVDALKKHESRVKFTVYPGVKHDSWTSTYNNDEIYTWLLEQKTK